MQSRASRPLHQKFKAIGKVRERLRSRFFRLIEKAFATDDGRAILAKSLGDTLCWRPDLHPSEELGRTPYTDLGKADASVRLLRSTDPVFITGRFRSGTTLVWNLFRNAGGFTAYYEPLNERRWFDAGVRGNGTDPTHRNVDDYWREYEGLTELGEYYREDWISHDLFMDEATWDPGLKRFIQILIERAPARPVLQFNRVDFRLPWLRHHFPEATLVHIYRHPRDQWCSSLRDDVSNVPREISVADFEQYDRFYLRMWAMDLKYRFPFLDERTVRHPYELFYYIWKLSFLYARSHCDLSVAYEDLVTDPKGCVTELFSAIRPACSDAERLVGLVEPPKLGKWACYANDAWFQSREASCEAVLADFFGPAAGRAPAIALPDTSRGRLRGGAAVGLARGRSALRLVP